MRKTLDQLQPSEQGRIVRVSGSGPVRRRMGDMGLTPGTLIEVIRAAPFRDPIEFRVRGYNLSLRKNEAADVEVDVEVEVTS